MASNMPFIPEKVANYLEEINAPRRTSAEQKLENATLGMKTKIEVMGESQQIGIMMVRAAEANFLALLTRLLSHRRKSSIKALEIGMFTGRSTLAIAQALPKGGKVITCDLTDEHLLKAQSVKRWEEAGVRDLIEVRLGDAKKTLMELESQIRGEEDAFDLVFIDADKQGYDAYYEFALRLLRPAGLIVLDNMLWSGRVADPEINDLDTVALRSLNEKISKDARVESILLGFEDGVMVAEKRGG